MYISRNPREIYPHSYRKSANKRDDTASDLKIQTVDWIRTCAEFRANQVARNHESTFDRPRASVALINSQQITRRREEERKRELRGRGRATILVANRKAPRDPTKAPSKGPLSSLSMHLVSCPFSTASLSFSLSVYSLPSFALFSFFLLHLLFSWSFPSPLYFSLSRRRLVLPSQFTTEFWYCLTLFLRLFFSLSLSPSLPHLHRVSLISPHLRHYHTNINDELEKYCGQETATLSSLIARRLCFFGSTR